MGFGNWLRKSISIEIRNNAREREKMCIFRNETANVVMCCVISTKIQKKK